MSDVRSHPLDRGGPPQVKNVGLAGGVELQQSSTELKALGPLSPPPRGVSPFDGKNRRALRRVEMVLDSMDLTGRRLPEPFDFLLQRACR